MSKDTRNDADKYFASELMRIITTLSAAEEDAGKLDAGNVSAGKRLREKSFRAISDLKALRKTAQASRNSITALRKTTKSNGN